MTHENKHLPWSPHDPHKCGACKGTGIDVRQIPSARYSCGFTTHAFTCGECLGSGRNLPAVPDMKLAAAGDAR